jgi:hypothetical protein
MKKFILFSLLILPLTVFCQKNFEGRIIYKFLKHNQLDGSTIEIIHGTNKIKTIISQPVITDRKKEETFTIFDFEKGLKFIVRDADSSYAVDSLIIPLDDDELFIPGKTKVEENILGYNCNKYTSFATDTAGNSIDTFLIKESFFSNGLDYIIPKKFRNKHGLITSEEGNIIWLKNNVYFNFRVDDSVSVKDTTIITADKIISEAVNNNIFVIPAYYRENATLRHRANITVELTEITIEEDEPAPPPPPPPPPKQLKLPSKKNTKQKPVKG